MKKVKIEGTLKEVFLSYFNATPCIDLADTAHKIWSNWTKYMLEQLEPLFESSKGWNKEDVQKAEDTVERWNRQIETDYINLSDKEKQSDINQVLKYAQVLKEPLIFMIDWVRRLIFNIEEYYQQHSDVSNILIENKLEELKGFLSFINHFLCNEVIDTPGINMSTVEVSVSKSDFIIVEDDDFEIVHNDNKAAFTEKFQTKIKIILKNLFPRITITSLIDRSKWGKTSLGTYTLPNGTTIGVKGWNDFVTRWNALEENIDDQIPYE